MEKDFWAGFIDDLISFFKAGKPPVKKEDTLATIAMYEAGMKVLNKPGSTIDIEQASN